MINSSFSKPRPRFRLLLLAAVSTFPGTVLAQTGAFSKHHPNTTRLTPAKNPVVQQPTTIHKNNPTVANEPPNTLETITVSAERRRQSTHDVEGSKNR
ncbi:hypothetical protein JK185_14630 [Gluconobacter wancherniae]|uniref:hypothetical protein n=1 Tax=Gluconobacter wancherniae TaxID=1307955 RepID=UPI001B8CB5C5|nr:hypothetical protein [Gluconobacter wancherniae]MBS1064227.1 hypothetical protein [Gluconobacter wancherniae]